MNFSTRFPSLIERSRLFAWAFFCACCAQFAAAQTPLGTSINYQGGLVDSGSPANAGYDLLFTLYDDEAAGSLVAGPLSVDGVAVAEGLFTVELDFGAGAFDGDQRWLEIQVSPAGDATYETLSPRQELTPAAYALYAAEAASLAGGVDDADADPANEIQALSGSGSEVTLSDGGGTLNVSALAASDGDPVDAATVDADGNVGIGTSSPTEKLHVDAGNVLQTPGDPVLAGSLAIGSSPESVFVSGRYAYVVDSGSDDLKVIDVSDPAAPFQAGSLGLDQAPQAVAVSGRYAYVVDIFSNDLKVIDVSNPRAPFEAGSLAIGANTFSVQVSGNYAYVVDIVDRDLKVIDVSNPNAPVLAGSLTIGAAPVAVYVSGRYAYVVDQSSDDLKVIDVSNPAAPALAGSLALGAVPISVYVSGRYAYVIDQSSEDLKVIDVSNPAAPVLAGSLPLGPFPTSVYVSGRYAYVVSFLPSDLKVIDVSNPAAPVLAGSLAIGLVPVSVCVSGRYAYVVDEVSDELVVIDVTGGEFGSLMAHSLEAGSLQVRDGITAQQAIQTMGGLAVGQSARVDGDASVGGTMTAKAFAGDGSALTGIADNVDDADADPANEIQTISASGSQVSLSGGGGSARVSALAASDGNPTNALVVDADGDVGVGNSAPEARLEVEADACCDETNPARFAARFVNARNSDAADVLWVETGSPLPSSSGKLIRFVGAGAALGAIQGNGAGGVTNASAGSDYAEWLPRLDPKEEIGPGDVVGVFGGLVSKSTDGADWTMVVSTAPNTLGNMPKTEAEEAAMEKVAFLGQAPARVVGPAMFGDYIVASGLDDGTAIAVSSKKITPEQGRLVVGRAWQASLDKGEKLLNTAIGIPQASSTTMALAREVRSIKAERDAEIERLRAQNAVQEERLRRQEERLARLEALLLGK